jgi:hypothetical protein
MDCTWPVTAVLLLLLPMLLLQGKRLLEVYQVLQVKQHCTALYPPDLDVLSACD